MFSRNISVYPFFISGRSVCCALILLTVMPDMVFSQSNARFGDMTQTSTAYVGQTQPPQSATTPQDKGLMIGGMFGSNDSRPGEPSQNASQNATSPYAQANPQKPASSLPDGNPVVGNDIPEEQRRSGVWSPESLQALDARNQRDQNATPQVPAVSQPQYQNNGNWTRVTAPPIRQASGEASEKEADFAVQPMPPLAPPTEPQPKPAMTRPLLAGETETPARTSLDSANANVDSQRSESPAPPPVPAFHETAAPTLLARLDNHETASSSPFLTANDTAQNADKSETSAVTSADETETGETSASKYSDKPMPKFYAKGEQKEEAAESGKKSVFGFLPKSSAPTMTVLSSLAIVLGVFFVLVWLMKRATPRQAGLLPKEVFEKLGSVPLSPKMHMHLFRLGGKLVLVSVTPDGMEPVAEVTDPDEVIHLIGLCKQSDPKSASTAFRQVLKQYTGEKGPQQQQQMTGGYVQQPMQQYPGQQYPPQNMQQAVRRPVGMVTPAKAYQR